MKILANFRHPSKLLKYEWAFIILSIITSVGVIGFSSYRLATIDFENTDFPFCIILIVHSLFSIYYAFNCVFTEKPYELAVLLLSSFVFEVYAAANYGITLHRLSKSTKLLKLLRLIYMSVCLPGFVALSVALMIRYTKNRGHIFNLLGADMRMQKMGQILFSFSSLMTFCLEMNICMIVLILNSDKSYSLEEQIILGLGSGIVLIWYIIGVIFPRIESRPLAYFFWALSWPAPAYVVYRMIKAADNLTSDKKNVKSLAIVAIMGGVLTILVEFSVAILSSIVYSNFGRGLGQKLYQQPSK
ncbi:hypothetical protein SNEBB_001279 [Seison nebaliae]|nr:hypothetical protein SNEBB_001279 [Seison nebaliae]